MKKIFLPLFVLFSGLFSHGLFAVDGLSPTEESDLLFMREEEKLAHDVYFVMGGLWQKRIFNNISESEQRHMDAMLNMINLYDLEDPVIGNGIGEFDNQELQALYYLLIEQGTSSVLDALEVGAQIEEKDILDINTALSNTSKNSLTNSYSNLLAGSTTHLCAFTGQIEKMGFDYEPQYLPPKTYKELISNCPDQNVGQSPASKKQRKKMRGNG